MKFLPSALGKTKKARRSMWLLLTIPFLLLFIVSIFLLLWNWNMQTWLTREQRPAGLNTVRTFQDTWLTTLPFTKWNRTAVCSLRVFGVRRPPTFLNRNAIAVMEKLIDLRNVKGDGKLRNKCPWKEEACLPRRDHLERGYSSASFGRLQSFRLW